MPLCPQTHWSRVPIANVAAHGERKRVRSQINFRFLRQPSRPNTPINHSTGSSNCAHHFGLKRGVTFGEQLILHDCVSHGSLPLLLTVASGAAAALAAGEDNEGGVGVVGGATATDCGSFFDRFPVAHPPSAKISKAAAGRMILI